MTEKVGREAVAEKIDAVKMRDNELFKQFCRALRICEDEIAQIVNTAPCTVQRKPLGSKTSRSGEHFSQFGCESLLE
jgi:hypothetical protein